MPEPPAYAARPEPGASPSPTAVRTGNKHGSVPAHEATADAATRGRLMRLAALPSLLVTAVSAGSMAYLLTSQEGGADGTAWSVAIGAAVVGCATVTGAAAAGDAQARSTARRYAALRRSAARGQADLQELLRRLGQGERVPPRPAVSMAQPSGDALDLLAHEYTQARLSAEDAVVRAAELVRGSSEGNEEKVEVFVNLARRLQSLVHREIELLDELENQVEDPDLLKGLFQVDHLATRIRRHAENLAVLGGAISRRQWSRPVTMTEVLRSSIAEVEQYSRVKLVPPIDGTLRGHAVADVIHLLAELVENATVFSAPQTQVLLRAQRVTSGLAIEVEDRGLGMPRGEQVRMNSLLADPDHVDVSELLRDGRIGLFVVAALARRHGIVVQLQSNIYGGIQAVLVVPQALLGDDGDDTAPATAPAASVPAPRRPEPVAAPSGNAVMPAPARMSAPLPPAVPAAQSPSAPGVPGPGHTPAPQHNRAPEPEPARMAVRASAEQPVTPAQHHAAPAGIAPAYPADDGGERPELPRRRRQEHLAPELRESRPTARREEEAEPEHDPGLMAAFRRGYSLAEAPDSPDGRPADSTH